MKHIIIPERRFGKFREHTLASRRAVPMARTGAWRDRAHLQRKACFLQKLWQGGKLTRRFLESVASAEAVLGKPRVFR